MDYEALLAESDSVGLVVKEKPLKNNNGRVKGNKIAIRQDINTSAEKACVLAEEMGHYHTSVGRILNQSDAENRKQELRAREWAYDRQVGLIGIVKSFLGKIRPRQRQLDDPNRDAVPRHRGPLQGHL